MRGVGLTDEIRTACAAVAARAEYVRIVPEAIEPYAAGLPAKSPPAPDLAPGEPDERRAAFQLTLNAVNFGSGWFPTLRKRPGMSGFRTVEARLREHGAFSDDELRAMDAATIAGILGQDPGHELMALYAAALNEIAGLEVASTDAVEIAEQLAALPMWHDPGFYKRAQIAAAELATTGTERLTMFADNLVPHVLRIDGVLAFDADLVARIDREELIEHDAPEEVEIRACAVHAVELLVAAHPGTTATAVDNTLWHRGGAPRYKAHPRHRTRTTAY